MPKCRVYQTSTLRMNNITRENIFFFYSQKFSFLYFMKLIYICNVWCIQSSSTEKRANENKKTELISRLLKHDWSTCEADFVEKNSANDFHCQCFMQNIENISFSHFSLYHWTKSSILEDISMTSHFSFLSKILPDDLFFIFTIKTNEKFTKHVEFEILKSSNFLSQPKFTL